MKHVLIVLLSLCLIDISLKAQDFPNNNRITLNSALEASKKTATSDTIKLGITLSGGAARGYAHIGVLQALHEANVQIDVISGTSMGAIIGLFYAAGYEPRQILELVKKERMDHVRRIVKNNHRRDGGLADYRFLRRIIYKYIPHNHFDSLQIPYYCCVTDLNHGQAVCIGHGGYLAQYVTASASIPFIFSPVIINGITYVDGFVMNDLPIEPLIQEGCNVTIGSYLDIDSTINQFRSRNEIWSRVQTLVFAANIHDRIPFFDYLIPINIHGLQSFDFDHVDAFYFYGYQAGRRLLDNHPELKNHHRPILSHKKRPEE